MNKKQELINKITEYLSNGGLFNPELMDDSEVQRLLIDIRDYLLDEADKTPNRYDPIVPLPYPPFKPFETTTYNHCPKCGLKLDQVMGYVCSTPHCPTGLGGTWCSS